MSRRVLRTLSPPSTAASSSVTSLGQADNLLDTGRLLLLLKSQDLLAAVPPLLLAELKRLGLDFLDEHRLGLDALPAEACHEDLLPLG